ncbi:PREDICTED: E3 ubiquitin-protein ligase RHF2A-like isoform X2 [Nelumbo nucifera]|nr:PREDICTED: E3 ubiquitin-protein ligase RHF2A-like isoform X2 [Nelumbo nucifera]
MDETKKVESLTSAAAFVEGGIQDACDDACSICLEAFCDSNPSTVTSCKHEFHLQCILEWCQRSSQCPMCWQPITLKDPTSQELLEAVERERTFRFNPPRNATIFHHPTLGDFELQHLPVGSNGAELEERIIQHLAAAAAMGRAHHIARREGQRSRASGQGRPQFLVFSTHPSAPAGAVTASLAQRGGENEQAPAITVASPSAPLTVLGEQPSNQTPELSPVQDGQIPSSASGSTTLGSSQSGLSFNNRSSAGHSSPVNQDRAGPSEFQSFSESLKSRFNAVSMRYKDSISKSTRGWRERFFSRSTSMADLSTEVKREVNAGIARVSSMMERLETRQNSRATTASIPNNLEGSSVTEPNNQSIAENTRGSSPLNDSNTSTYCAASSGSH